MTRGPDSNETCVNEIIYTGRVELARVYACMYSEWVKDVIRLSVYLCRMLH